MWASLEQETLDKLFEKNATVGESNHQKQGCIFFMKKSNILIHLFGLFILFYFILFYFIVFYFILSYLFLER